MGRRLACVAYLILAVASVVDARQLQEQPAEQYVGVKRASALAAEGGAAVYLQRLSTEQPNRLKRILRRSHVEESALPALAKMLDEDDDLVLDLDNDILMFECQGLKLDNAVAMGVTPQSFEPDPLASQAFQLSSRPSATRKIWLDFKGATITGTAWNTRHSASIVQPAYDKDNNPSSFSTAELNDIVAIWRAVAEDYAIFDVDVTTIKPASLQGNMWVSIGGDASWYGSTPGGVANVGVFGNSFYQPAFVFSKNLGPNYAKYVWEAASHEIGHTLGLFHDGVTGGSSYYSGQGDWAPIMGAGYYKHLTTWDKGEYTNSNQQQDDVAVMSKYLPLLSQVAGNSMAAATPLRVSTASGTSTGTADGVVVQQNAANYYSFQAGAGAATFQVDVMLPWTSSNWARSNLDAQLVVYASNGNIIASINPAGVSSSNGLGISPITVQLPAAGTYYVAVSGASAGDPKGTGYTNYGSRGAFQLTVKFPAATAVNPTPESPPPSTPTPQSPSPSPNTPSPSTPPANPPVPSPSPNTPVTQQPSIKVSEIKITKRCFGLCSCSARVYLTDAATGAKLPVQATVAGVWTASPTPSSWKPYPYPSKGTVTVAKGYVDLYAPLQGNSGSCTFTVNDVKATGYTWSPTSIKRGRISLRAKATARRFRAGL